MYNRVKTLEVTKAYAEAFNARDLASLGQMLDDEKIIFSRQEQSTIAGKENVLRRIRNLYYRIDQQNQSLYLINAIADIGKTKARACLVGLVDGKAKALCLVSCKVNGLITTIAVLTDEAIVASARLTEEIPLIYQDDEFEEPEKELPLRGSKKTERDGRRPRPCNNLPVG